MDPGDCYLLGYVRKSHGNHGDLLLKLDADHPEVILKEESLLIEIDGRLVPFFLRHARLTREGEAIIGLEDVTNTEEASALVGQRIFLPLDVLPPLEGKKFYFHEVEGFMLRDQHGEDIGRVETVLEYPGHPILKVDRNGVEVMVPVHDDLIIAVNRPEKVIVMDLPEGLLEVYVK